MLKKGRITFGDDSLQIILLPLLGSREGLVVRTDQCHRHTVVVTDFVKTDGFETVGLLETETVGAGGKELYSEAFTGKSDGGIEIRTVRKVDF